MRTVHLFLLSILLAVGGVVYAFRPGSHKAAATRNGETEPAMTAQEKAAQNSPSALPAGDQEHLREAWKRVGDQLDKARNQREILLSGAAHRPGESEPLYQERQRTIADYERFIQIGHVAPDQDQQIRSLVAEAQENWDQAVRSAGKANLDMPMADPVLGPVLTTLSSDFYKSVQKVLPAQQAAMFQSFNPSLLAFVRTKAFVAN